MGKSGWVLLCGAPELPELGEAARLPGERTSSSKKKDSAEFFPTKHQITPQELILPACLTAKLITRINPTLPD